MIAATVALIAAGGVANTILGTTQAGPTTYPQMPDVCHLLAYLSLTVGLLWLGRPQFPSNVCRAGTCARDPCQVRATASM